MNELDKFHLLVGRTMMECQCIEHDVKVIYAAMRKGDFGKNYEYVSSYTLGKTLVELEELDICNVNPYFSVNDYELLDSIRNIRNHWAHRGYVEFVYKNGDDFNRVFAEQYKRLRSDYDMLVGLSAQTEKIRFEVMKKFGRM